MYLKQAREEWPSHEMMAYCVKKKNKSGFRK